MSSELDEVARALFNGQIPNIWRKLAPATLKSLGNWMEHFLKRLNQYNKWVSKSPFTVVMDLLGEDNGRCNGEVYYLNEVNTARVLRKLSFYTKYL